MEDPSRCHLLPEGRSSPREVEEEEVEVAEGAAVVCFKNPTFPSLLLCFSSILLSCLDLKRGLCKLFYAALYSKVFVAEVALVGVPRLMSGEETGLVPTGLDYVVICALCLRSMQLLYSFMNLSLQLLWKHELCQKI